MTYSFNCLDTEALFNSRPSRRFKNIERVALRKLLQIHAATDLQSLRVPPGTSLSYSNVIEKGSTVSELMINGGCVLFGKRTVPTKLKLLTSTFVLIHASLTSIHLM